MSEHVQGSTAEAVRWHIQNDYPAPEEQGDWVAGIRFAYNRILGVLAAHDFHPVFEGCTKCAALPGEDIECVPPETGEER